MVGRLFVVVSVYRSCLKFKVLFGEGVQVILNGGSTGQMEIKMNHLQRKDSLKSD